MSNNLSNRSINSIKWNSVSNIVNISVNGLQTIVLARLLPVESFGILAGAASIVVLTGSISGFGMGAAFNFRCTETENLDYISSVHFTLQLLLNLIWTTVMLLGGFLFIRSSEESFLTAFLVLTFSKFAMNFFNTHRMILVRLVEHRRLALIKIVDVILSFIVSTLLAILGKPIWSLLSIYIVSVIVNFLLLLVWRPYWRPSLKWSKTTVKYLLTFGSKQFVSRLLLDALDRIDEIWANFYLGSIKLGFYSKAYTFAGYPAAIVANPINSVATGTFSEIAHDRKKLSDVFHKLNSFLIRSGFYFGGLLILIAPEFVMILLGEKWMPMVMTFRLMLPFALFDPMQQSLSKVFIAVGKPETLVKTRVIQLVVMIVGLFMLGNSFNIEGVALAVDLMMVVGIIMVLFQVKKYVDYSINQLFKIPFFALAIGMTIGLIFDFIYASTISDILSGIVKIIGFSALYFGLLILFDRKEMKSFYRLAEKYLFSGKYD